MHRYKYSIDLIKKSINETFDTFIDENYQDSKYIQIFNPSSYKRQESVELFIDIIDSKKLDVVIYDSLNNRIPVQSKVDLVKNSINIVFLAEVEGLKIEPYKLELIELNNNEYSNMLVLEAEIQQFREFIADLNYILE
jgi:hypothetical protein